MTELKPLICTQCGGQIDRDRMICPYCGTQYKKENDQLVRIETFSNPVRVYEANMTMPNFWFDRDKDGVTDFMVRELAHKLTQAIIENMEIEHEFCPLDDTQRFRAKVRMVNPIHRF